MKWEHPPMIKIYEALGSFGDGRVQVSGNTAKVYSSSGSKYYDVTYDPASRAIMANDNASFFKGYLGYPAIAFLMSIGVVPFDQRAAMILKGIAWKDINTKFKNDFDKTLAHILSHKTQEERDLLEKEVRHIDAQIRELSLSLLGNKVQPPTGY